MTAPNVVWTGRFPDSWPAGRDSWRTSRDDLLGLLAQAPELVVVDAPSYPWSTLSRRTDMPVVVRLPDGLSADELSDLLGRVLLTRITPYDRLLCGRAGVREELSARWDLADEVWLPWDAPGDEGPDTGWEPVLEAHLARPAAEIARAGAEKGRHLETFQVAADELLDVLWPPDEQGQDRIRKRVAVSGDVRRRRHRLANAVVADVDEVATIVASREGPTPIPAPDAVVVWLADGEQSVDERRAVLAGAHEVLAPGAWLVVVAHVVDTDDGRANPSISTLVEDLHAATGTLVHLAELRSVRWAGERRTRGAVLRLASLRAGVI